MYFSEAQGHMAMICDRTLAGTDSEHGQSVSDPIEPRDDFFVMVFFSPA